MARAQVSLTSSSIAQNTAINANFVELYAGVSSPTAYKFINKNDSGISTNQAVNAMLVELYSRYPSAGSYSPIDMNDHSVFMNIKLNAIFLALYTAIASGPVTLTAPAALSARWTIPFAITQNGSTYTSDVNFASLAPTITKTYYVDPINGSDAALGTIGAPLQSVSVAIAKSDVDAISLILTADTIFWGTRGVNATQPARSIALINPTPQFRPFMVPALTNVAPTFTVNGTFSNVFQCAATATGQVVDTLNLSAVPTPSISASFTAAHAAVVTNAPKRARVYSKQTSIANVAANAGSWYNDGTNCYINPIDGRNLVGDQKMAVCSAQTTNLRYGSGTNNLTYYVQDVDFLGGGNTIFVQINSGLTGTMVLNHCLIQGASTASGYGIQGIIKSYLYRCTAADNFQDGYNYHSVNGDGTTAGTSPFGLEQECVAYGNGTTGSGGTSDNETTAHDYSSVIRVSGVYLRSDDRTFCDINFAISWNLGLYIAQAVKTSTADLTSSVVTLNSAQVYLDGASVPPGSNPQAYPDNTSTIAYRNPVQAFASGGGTGTFTTY